MRLKFLKLIRWQVLISFMVLLFFYQNVMAKTYEAKSRNEILDFISQLNPGDTLEIAPGEYIGGIKIQNLNGTKSSPVTIKGKEIGNSPLFKGGKDGFNVSYCNNIPDLNHAGTVFLLRIL